MGAFERDQEGNIYVSPMPYVSLLDNPPETQNQIYKIDAKTGEMSLFIKLPGENQLDSRNPFGVMGLFFDCDTDSLYVTSLAGSLPLQEKGRIYQIDLKTRKILSKLENTDAIGVGVFNTKAGKRLYFGSARNSHVYSVALNAQGHFANNKRYEYSLSQIKGGDSTVVKRIVFSRDKQGRFLMVVQEVEFGFRLFAENNPYRKKYIFAYDEEKGKWSFLKFTKES